jgi:predicted nucleic acid-binding protein
MRAVFADASYWIALLNPEDVLHEKAQNVSMSFGRGRIVTSEMVLTEVLDDFSRRGRFFREAAVSLVERLRQNSNVSIIKQTSKQFQDALSLYAQRSDKSWGLTDCSSLRIMSRYRLTQALTHDRHFLQAGFQALLRDHN